MIVSLIRLLKPGNIVPVQSYIITRYIISCDIRYTSVARSSSEILKKHSLVSILLRYYVQRLILLPGCKQCDRVALHKYSSKLHETVDTVQKLGQSR
jgi:hypothetical protein